MELEGLSGLQQTTLQHCQDTIAGLEETVVQLVASVKKLEKMVCWCHDQLLLPGPHYTPGEEEEVVGDLEEEEEEDLKYETDAPSGGSYTTPPVRVFDHYPINLGRLSNQCRADVTRCS